MKLYGLDVHAYMEDNKIGPLHRSDWWSLDPRYRQELLERQKTGEEIWTYDLHKTLFMLTRKRVILNTHTDSKKNLRLMRKAVDMTPLNHYLTVTDIEYPYN